MELGQVTFRDGDVLVRPITPDGTSDGFSFTQSGPVILMGSSSSLGATTFKESTLKRK